MKKILWGLAALAMTGLALAKLPPPSDEAKAKAAEAAARTAWSGKVDAYLLCKSQDRVAAYTAKTSKAAGKEVKPAVETPACADPGPFVYTPPGAAPATAAPVAAAPAAATARKP